MYFKIRFPNTCIFKLHIFHVASNSYLDFLFISETGSHLSGILCVASNPLASAG